MPVARRVLGESNDLTLQMRWVYARALYGDPGATLDDLREAVTTFEDVERIARRVFGGQHPFTVDTERGLRLSRAKLRAREDAEPDVSAQELDAAEAAHRARMRSLGMPEPHVQRSYNYFDGLHSQLPRKQTQ